MQTTTAQCPACEHPIEIDMPEEGEFVECPGCDCVSIVSQVEPLVLVAEDEDDDDYEEEDDDDDGFDLDDDYDDDEDED